MVLLIGCLLNTELYREEIHHAFYDVNVQMTQLEKLQADLKNYETTYTGMFDCNSAVQYNVIYQRQTLTELLEKEIPTMKHRKEYIDNIVDLACIKHCASVVNELATKYVSQNVSEINNVLKNTRIKEEEILKRNEDAFQAFFTILIRFYKIVHCYFD